MIWHMSMIWIPGKSIIHISTVVCRYSQCRTECDEYFLIYSWEKEVIALVFLINKCIVQILNCWKGRFWSRPFESRTILNLTPKMSGFEGPDFGSTLYLITLKLVQRVPSYHSLKMYFFLACSIEDKANKTCLQPVSQPVEHTPFGFKSSKS